MSNCLASFHYDACAVISCLSVSELSSRFICKVNIQRKSGGNLTTPSTLDCDVTVPHLTFGFLYIIYEYIHVS